MKNSILRESGIGRNSPPMSSLASSTSGGSITSPLRISRRYSPGLTRGADVPRRNSSSGNNNLVSNFPFQSQILTPSTPSQSNVFALPTSPTQRVLGEKRPRSVSLLDSVEAEDETPLALTREKKQSKTFQGIIAKEPVTRSRFKSQQSVSQENALLSALPPALPLPSPFQRTHTSPASLPIPVPSHASTWTSSSLSPLRSSLVSRRLHGPRLSVLDRRERCKAVGYDERCDVIEFDIEEENIIDAKDEYGDSDDEHEFQDGQKHIEDEGDGGELFFRGTPRRPPQKLGLAKL